MVEPKIEQIHFGPATAGCASRAGWARLTNGVEVAVCLPGERICLDGVDSTLTNPAKFCGLHELAHAWLVQNVSAETEVAFLAHTGLDTWMTTEDTPWHKRGVEYAAETIAWGLMDTRLNLIRLADPDCRQIEIGFGLITGATPLVHCDDAR
ncbi:MAG: hypothetical protein ACR2QK_21125 [Acidimicrobiales bacterium]